MTTTNFAPPVDNYEVDNYEDEHTIRNMARQHVLGAPDAHSILLHMLVVVGTIVG